MNYLLLISYLWVSEFGARVKTKAPDAVVTDCILHRQALASKTLPQTLKYVMYIAVQVVNFIRTRAMNHRLFKKNFEVVDSTHDVLLYHTKSMTLNVALFYHD